jgi:hypothetical protein
MLVKNIAQYQRKLWNTLFHLLLTHTNTSMHQLFLHLCWLLTNRFLNKLLQNLYFFQNKTAKLFQASLLITGVYREVSII